MSLKIGKTALGFYGLEISDVPTGCIYGPIIISQDTSCPSVLNKHNEQNHLLEHRELPSFPPNSVLMFLTIEASKQIYYMADNSAALADHLEKAKLSTAKYNLDMLGDTLIKSEHEGMLVDLLSLPSIPKYMRWSLVKSYHRYRWNRWKINALEQYMKDEEESSDHKTHLDYINVISPRKPSISQGTVGTTWYSIVNAIDSVIVSISYIPRLIWLYVLMPFAVLSCWREGYDALYVELCPENLDGELEKKLAEKNDVSEIVMDKSTSEWVQEGHSDTSHKEKRESEPIAISLDDKKYDSFAYIMHAKEFLEIGSIFEDMLDSRIFTYRRCCTPNFIALLEICERGSDGECDTLRKELRSWVRNYCSDTVNGLGILFKKYVRTIDEYFRDGVVYDLLRDTSTYSVCVLIALAHFDPKEALSLIVDVVSTTIDAHSEWWMNMKYEINRPAHPDPFATSILAEHEVILQIWSQSQDRSDARQSVIRKTLRKYMLYWSLKRNFQRYPYHVCNHRWMHITHNTAKRLLELV